MSDGDRYNLLWLCLSILCGDTHIENITNAELFELGYSRYSKPTPKELKASAKSNLVSAIMREEKK